MDPSVSYLADDHVMQRFLLGDDKVLVKAAAAAVGTEPLKALVIHFTEKGELVNYRFWMAAALSVMSGLPCAEIQHPQTLAVAWGGSPPQTPLTCFG